MTQIEETQTEETQTVSQFEHTHMGCLATPKALRVIERLFSILSLATRSSFYFCSARGNSRMVWVERDEPAGIFSLAFKKQTKKKKVG